MAKLDRPTMAVVKPDHLRPTVTKPDPLRWADWNRKQGVPLDESGHELLPFETWLWVDMPKWPGYAICPEGYVLDKSAYLAARKSLESGSLAAFGTSFTSPRSPIVPVVQVEGYTAWFVKLKDKRGAWKHTSLAWLLADAFMQPRPPRHNLEIYGHWFHDQDVKHLVWVPTPALQASQRQRGKPAKIGYDHHGDIVYIYSRKRKTT